MFSKKRKKIWILDWISEAQITKNPEKKDVEKYTFFLVWFFCMFLRFFENLAEFWSAWALQKFEKIEKNRIFNVLSFEGWFWEGSGTVWEWFFDGFGLILKGFGIDFWSFLGGFGRISNDYKLWRLQNLLWWLGRRGADQWMDGWMNGWMEKY